MSRYRWYAMAPALAAGLFTGIVGCADSTPAQPTGTVIGTVKHAGKPVAEGVVNFESRELGAAAQATIKEGEFEVPAPLPLGQYRVTVTPPPPPPPVPGKTNPRPKVADIPVRYQTQRTSDLATEIKQGENEVTFDLK